MYFRIFSFNSVLESNLYAIVKKVFENKLKIIDFLNFTYIIFKL